MNDLYSIVARQGPEAELLLLCGRADTAAQHQPRLAELIEHSLDWSVILGMARKHAVLPRLFQMLNSAGWQSVPSKIRESITAEFRANTMRNLAMVGELSQIIAACRANAIPIIAFKGPALAHRLYGNFAMRSFLDLDLLVSARDTTRLFEVLSTLGYQFSLGLRPDQCQAYLRARHQIGLAKKSRAWLLEIHTALLRSGSAWTTYEALVQRSEDLEIGGLKTSVLAPEQMMIYLCAHGTKHRWQRLGWLCDVAQLARTYPNLDWPWIRASVKQLHWERPMQLGLKLADELLGCESINALSCVQERECRVVRSLAAEVASDLFVPRESNHNGPRSLWFHTRSRERFVDAARSVWDISMEPTLADWKFLPLPGSLSFLYYIVRPSRLVGKYVAATVRSIARRRRQLRYNAARRVKVTSNR